MIKIKKHIEIVRSNVVSLSSMSQGSSNAILGVLAKNFISVLVTTVDNLQDLQALISRKPDLVFLGMEFIFLDPDLSPQTSEKIWIARYLEERGIVCTGSSQPAHELQRNKALAKQRVLDSNLTTSPYLVIKQHQPPSRDEISLIYPLFIKPTDRGSGVGIDSNSVAYNFEQLVSKVRSISSTLQSDSIIEEYLPGREFSVAILKDENSANYSVMPIELIAPKDKYGFRILSEKIKTSDKEQVLKIIEEDVRSSVTELALNIFNALGACDYGRIDIRLDKNGKPHFLEANLIPSLISGYGSFPKACILNIGLEYEPMILRIVTLGLNRCLDKIEDYSITESLKEIVSTSITATA